MKNHKKLKLLILATTVSLILSLFFTAPAIADDATPPPATEEPALPPTAEPVVQEEAPTLPEVLDQLPADTSVVVVVDEQVEPLATQSAANVFVVGDPIWCVEGDAPTPGAGNCTDAYPDLISLIDDIDSGVLVLPDVDGTIWITGGSDISLSDISIDGTNVRFAALSDNSLTLQGGWSGVKGDFSTSGSSVFSIPISIVNWSGTVTINQITVNGTTSTGLEIGTSDDVSLNSVSVENNSETGLIINSAGDIEVKNLTASGNGAGGVSGNGAELNSSSGSVTLTGINTFENNLESGLVVDVVGDIEVENLTASGNGKVGGSGNGAELNSSTGGVTLAGINTFENNLESGLVVDVVGDIDVENLIASGNGAGGSGGGAELNSLNNSVSLTGTNIFHGNHDTGLFIDAARDVDLENITADGNSTGVDLSLSGSLSLTGVNVFNNRETGLYAEAVGDIDAENITAYQNGLAGGFGNGAELYTLGSFSLVGTNVFIGNHDTGLYVDAVGDIDAENITSNENKASGAEFFTLGNFTLMGTNTFDKNGVDGLFVDAVGNISIENTTARANVGSGIYLETNLDASITCGLFNNNGGYEIEADLPGTLTLSGVDFGGSIDDDLGADEDQLVFISKGCFAYPAAVEKNKINAPVLPPQPILPINKVKVADGQIVQLNCTQFQGTELTFSNGDGAYVPCQIVDSARLVKLPLTALPSKLPDGISLVSNFNLTITKNGQAFKPVQNPGSVWYVDSSASRKKSDSQVLYWNGVEWIEITDQIYPFMSVFFSIPDAMKNANLAILYWDGVNWIELSDGQYFGDGRIVQKGGFINKYGFFEANINFIGTFALVQK